MRFVSPAAAVLATGVVLLTAAELKVGADRVVVHEWGTFTSVANETGAAVQWAPLDGPSDLPCFVTHARLNIKGGVRGLVRMETPVLYFYAQHPATLSVRVDFPQGRLTEWYPNPIKQVDPAAHVLNWERVQVTPGVDPAYPTTDGPSHYYAARHTDSAPLEIGIQHEKMIFYRGVGSFVPPVQAGYTSDGKIEVANIGFDPLPFVMAFESQNGRIGYRIAENVTHKVTLDAPELTGDVAGLRENLAARLAGLGLYPKEARAMVDTWADSWFNDGARVFYIVPRTTVDSLLPLTITPAPGQIQRVFVGRVEVLSGWMKDRIQHAVRSGDGETLTEEGRFLQPFLEQMQRSDAGFKLTREVQRYVGAVVTGQAEVGNGYGADAPEGAACVE